MNMILRHFVWFIFIRSKMKNYKAFFLFVLLDENRTKESCLPAGMQARLAVVCWVCSINFDGANQEAKKFKR
ncbi:MAG: hypothetical protein EAZ15_09410 [Sphingobacteriales bacterium]|nr:MAG: hypothetical protein EAZ15_09410 [Sphingobacteriales bacterium]